MDLPDSPEFSRVPNKKAAFMIYQLPTGAPYVI